MVQIKTDRASIRDYPLNPCSKKSVFQFITMATTIGAIIRRATIIRATTRGVITRGATTRVRPYVLLPFLFLACAQAPDAHTQKLMTLRQKYGCSTILQNATIARTLTLGFTNCPALDTIQNDSILYKTAREISINAYLTLLKDSPDTTKYDRVAINLITPRLTNAETATTRQAVFEMDSLKIWAMGTKEE
jgi:hypothetical protein